MKRMIIVVAVLACVPLAYVGSLAAHHLLPVAWTGEAERLARLIEAAPGSQIAEIGGGRGEMAREMAEIVGRGGKIYVTELSDERRAALVAVARAESLPQMIVVQAAEAGTNLPTACCTALYMRNVLHHIADWDGYARDVRRTVQPGSAVAVIDFAPGAFFHMAADHGASPDAVAEAFVKAGFQLSARDDDWGGGTYLLLFKSPARPEPRS